MAMLMVFSGFALPVTGIGTHFYGFAPVSVQPSGPTTFVVV